MEVILRSDVDNLGRLGDQVSVKPGYARNYLIPQGLAMPATTSNLKQFELERKKLEVKVQAQRDAAKSLAEQLGDAEIIIEVRVGEGGKLYGSVTASMIGDALEAKGIELDKRKILLDAPIRSMGEFAVPVKLHPEVTADLSVAVIRKGGSIEELRAEAEQQAEEEAVESAKAALDAAGEAEEAPAEPEAEEKTPSEPGQEEEVE